jgi:sporulation protein YlmC with PRC-barrel domain
MLKIARYSIPLIVATLVFTGRTQETSTRDSQQPGASQERLTQQQRNQQSTFQPGRISDTQLNRNVTEVNKASSFIGMAVKNTQNQDLGKINDLVFDPQSGRISYAVISIGGALGIGDKLIAVPVTSLRPQPGQKHLLLNMDKAQIQSAPGLAQGKWPDLDARGVGAPAGGETGAFGQPGSSSQPGSTPGSSTTPGSSRTPGASTTPGSSSPSSTTPSSTTPDSTQRRDQ